jgi:hypothetical protein
MHFAPAHALVAGITVGMSAVDPANVKLAPGAWIGANKALAAHGAAGPAQGPIQEEAQEQRPPSTTDMENFFLPEWLALRVRPLLVADITQMQKTAWERLLDEGHDWVHIERVHGGAAVRSTYKRIVSGGLGPTTGLAWSMWEEEDQAPIVEKGQTCAKL